MDSTNLDQFAFDLQLDDEIRDQMSQYMQNNEDFKEDNNEPIGLPTSDTLVHRNRDIANTASFEMSTFINKNFILNDKCEYMIDIQTIKQKLSLKINDVCQKVIREMNSLGVCVVDNFMEEIGDFIYQEVINLYKTVVFSDGQVVNSSMCEKFDNKSRIRGDSIYWVNGREPNCKYINILMQTLDRIIFKCNKMNNNGLMGVNSISSRTSAMIACYPGNGSHYMKHADNSIADGRYITCIYYINKNWEPLRDGGLLRIYPNQVAIQEPLNIVPEFDRLIFFWSDRRNLHEVLPTKRLRFAITVWYFDDEERKRFKCHQNKFEAQ